MGWAPAEIEARARVRRLISAPIAGLLPVRIRAEIETFGADGYVVQPRLARRIPCLEHRQQSKVGEGGALSPEFRVEAAGCLLVTQGEGQQTVAVVCFGIVAQLPGKGPAGGNQTGIDPFAGNDLADDPGACSPAPGAIFKVAMEALPTAIDAHHQGVRSAPTVERTGVEEA